MSAVECNAKASRGGCTVLYRTESLCNDRLVLEDLRQSNENVENMMKTIVQGDSNTIVYKTVWLLCAPPATGLHAVSAHRPMAGDSVEKRKHLTLDSSSRITNGTRMILVYPPL